MYVCVCDTTTFLLYSRKLYVCIEVLSCKVRYLQQGAGSSSQGVAVVGVELAREGATTLVAEVVRHEVELAVVLFRGVQLF